MKHNIVDIDPPILNDDEGDLFFVNEHESRVYFYTLQKEDLEDYDMGYIPQDAWDNYQVEITKMKEYKVIHYYEQNHSNTVRVNTYKVLQGSSLLYTLVKRDYQYVDDHETIFEIDYMIHTPSPVNVKRVSSIIYLSRINFERELEKVQTELKL